MGDEEVPPDRLSTPELIAVLAGRASMRAAYVEACLAEAARRRDDVDLDEVRGETRAETGLDGEANTGD